MNHTTKFCILVAALVAVIGLTGCSGSVDGKNDNEPVETVHEHTWGNAVITKKPTCSEKGEKILTCECGEQKKEEIAAQHDFQGGYCETCGEYEFENHIRIKVFTDFEIFCKFLQGKPINKDSTEPLYDKCCFSFAENEGTITANELLHTKTRYLNWTVCYDWKGDNVDDLTEWEIKDLIKGTDNGTPIFIELVE